MRLAVPLAIALLAGALLAGCGGSSGSGSGSTGSAPAKPPTAESSKAPAGATATACVIEAGGIRRLRVTGVSCGGGRKVAVRWRRAAGCALGSASRSGCDVGPYRCSAARTSRGVAVSCARPGRSLAFLARPE